MQYQSVPLCATTYANRYVYAIGLLRTYSPCVSFPTVFASQLNGTARRQMENGIPSRKGILVFAVQSIAQRCQLTHLQ